MDTISLFFQPALLCHNSIEHFMQKLICTSYIYIYIEI